MATPSGQISLNDVNVELGLAGTTLITMNDTNVRTLAGVPSGAISMQNLQNKSNRVVSNITISSDTANYTLNTAKVTGYSTGKTDVTLTISPGVNVYSASTGSYALTVDTSWTTGDTVTIVNNGTIVGRGGNGGLGRNGYGPGRGDPGGAGGPALLVQRATTMNNLNRISGGGGGGGGGNFGSVPGPGKGTSNTSGGGGGGGVSFGTGGESQYDYPYRGSSGGTATATTAGGGGAGGGHNPGGNPGGNGGGYGSSGSGGARGQMPGAAPTGGSAGACIVGNANITYINTGTRNGSIS